MAESVSSQNYAQYVINVTETEGKELVMFWLVVREVGLAGPKYIIKDGNKDMLFLLPLQEWYLTIYN